jgi:hypothetical protein
MSQYNNVIWTSLLWQPDLSLAVPWLRRLVASLSPRRPGFVNVGFVVEKVALGQVFPRVIRFSPVNFIPPVLHYLEKWKKKLIIFITGLHNKSQGCGASVVSAAGPLKKTCPWQKFTYFTFLVLPLSSLTYHLPLSYFSRQTVNNRSPALTLVT